MEFTTLFDGLVTNAVFASLWTPVRQQLQVYLPHTITPAPPAAAEDALPDLMSLPLALGYFYNIVIKLEDQLHGVGGLAAKQHLYLSYDEFLAKQGLSDTTPEALRRQLNQQKYVVTEPLAAYEPSQIDLVLIYPASLNKATLIQCSEYLRHHTERASVEHGGAGRSYGFNYQLVREDGGGSRLRIVDYVRPVEAIPRYYRSYRPELARGEAWAERQELEMQAFLGTLRLLLEEESNYFAASTYFQPIG